MRNRLIVTFLSGIITGLLFAQDINDRESEYKAYFIYTFSKYVGWEGFEVDSSFVIGVIGDSKLIPYLEKIARVKSIKGKKITIKLWTQVDSIKECHMLFIPNSKKDQLVEIKKNIQGKNILTISDTPGFADKGVCINLVKIDDRIGFEVNMKAITDSTLKVSSQLLKLAKLII